MRYDDDKQKSKKNGAPDNEFPDKSKLKLGAGRPSSTVGSSKSTRPKRRLTDEKGNKVKISQAEIDAVKKMGMKKALAAAGKNPVAGANSSDASNFKQAKLVEAVRRLYGDTRFQNAIYKPKASPGPNMNTLNLYGAAKPRLGGNANAREDRRPKRVVPASEKTLNKYGAPSPQKKVNANTREGRIPQRYRQYTKRGD